MIRHIGRTAATHRRTVLLVWALLFVAGTAAGPALFSSLSADTGGSDASESERAYARLAALAQAQPPDEADGPEVYAVVDGAAVDDPAVRAGVESAVADVTRMPGVARVHDVYATGDERLRADDGLASAVVVVFRRTSDGHLDEHRSAVVARLRAIDAPRVLVGSEDMVDDELAAQAEEDLARGEAVALPVAFLVMVVVFGGVLAAGLPVLLSLASVGAALLVLLAVSAVGDVAVYAINVVTMLGLGLGIDYGLLVVSRFREERTAGLSVPAAIERTAATAGVTVAFSGLTVAVSLTGLLLFDDDGLRSLAVGGIGVVLIAVAAALTLLPALLAVVGRRIRPASARQGADGGVFAAVARAVQRRALPVVLAVTTVLVLAAVPFADARFEQPDARWLPRSSEARQLDEIRRTRFPDVGPNPIEVVVEAAEGDPSLRAYVDEVAGLPGVVSVATEAVAAAVTLVEVVPEGPESGGTAQALVHRLRLERPSPSTLVAGDAAELIDFKASVGERIPYAAGLVVAATLVLLFLMTGSVVVAAKAIVMNVLSLGASFGVLVWVFQDGHLSGLLGFDPVGALDATMPVAIFVFAFGLSMDYEVFLLARIKEAWDTTGDNDVAVVRGLQASGRIITSAALLIVVVFAGFAAGELLLIKQLGVGLAVAVVVDVTVVRTLLVPATMKLLGSRNWWAPAPLRRLHGRVGLHEPVVAPA